MAVERVQRTRTAIAATVLAVMTGVLVGCQEGGPPALSLEEAKQVTATFERSSFTPPPKSIRDITAILDQQRLVNPAALRIASAKAKEEPGPGLSEENLVEFLWRRGQAAGEIGEALAKLSWPSRRDVRQETRSASERTRTTVSSESCSSPRGTKGIGSFLC